MKPIAAVLESANARQDDAIGPAQFLRIMRHENFGPYPTFIRGALKGLFRRAEIAGPIIDDSDTHHAMSVRTRSPCCRWKYFSSAS